MREHGAEGIGRPAGDEGVWELSELDRAEEQSTKAKQWVMVAPRAYKAMPPTHPKLPTGAYSVTLDRNDDVPIFLRKDVKTDDIVPLEKSWSHKILKEISVFWDRREYFRKAGFLHRRGYLLYGPQGTGKSSVVQQIIAGVIERQGIVLFCENPKFFNKALSIFRQAEPECKLVCIFEDIDAIIKRYGEDELLSILDGANMVDRVLNLATCFPPDVRFLTHDLRWVPCGDLRVGDELWGFDEAWPTKHGARRRYRKSVVTRSHRAMKECVRVTFDTGESIVCTTDHPWLSSRDAQQKSWRLGWTPAEDLLDAPNMVRPFLPWDTETSYEAGWLAGILDGEGCVSGSAAKRGHVVTIAQNSGATADKIEAALRSRVDVHAYERRTRSGMKVFDVRGGVPETARLIGSVRSERLISNLNLEGGMMLNKFPVRAVAVERVGMREIQSIETSTHTYIAEGFACHNTNYPESLDRRIVSRPRRFDRVIRVGLPDESMREEYLRSKLPEKGEKNLGTWVRKTEGLSFAGITEAIISVYCLGNSFEETLQILRDIENGNPSSSDFKADFGTKLGFQDDGDKDDDSASGGRSETRSSWLNHIRWE